MLWIISININNEIGPINEKPILPVSTKVRFKYENTGNQSAHFYVGLWF